MKKLLIFFAAGCLGGLANALTVWIFGALGITNLLGVGIAPSLTKTMIYQRMVWGGIWGITFFIPLLKNRIVLKGIILSILPTLVQLFVVFPFKAHKGIAGLDLGMLTPLFVVIFNGVWGLVAAVAIKSSD